MRTLRSGLQRATLAEFGFIATRLVLLQDAFTKPDPAILPAALSDPDFPADLRPEDPDGEDAWWEYFEQVVRDFVRERFDAPENATPEEMLTAERRITKEMTDVVTYYEQVRTRERAVSARQQQLLESGAQIEDEDSVAPSAALQQSEATQDQSQMPDLLSTGYGPAGYAGQSWQEGGMGVEIAWWPRPKTPNSGPVG